MKTFFLHVITPIVNIIVYLLAFMLMRLWAFFLGFFNGAVPANYQTDPQSLLWTFICSAFGVFAMAATSKYLAPSGKKVHFFAIVALLVFGLVFSFLTKGIEAQIVIESLGLIAGTVGGYFYLKNKD